MILKLTEKARKAYGVSDRVVHGNPLYIWHAHLFYSNGKKSLIFLNEKSRIVLVMFNVTSEIFHHRLKEVFEAYFSELCYRNGMKPDFWEGYLSRMGEIEFARADHRGIASQFGLRLWEMSCYFEHTPEGIDTHDLNGWLSHNLTTIVKDYEIPWDFFVNAVRNEMDPTIA